MTRPALPLAVLLPAAGASRRMRGRDKLLEKIDGAPLLQRQAAVALSLGAPVLVTLAPGKPARAASLQGLSVEAQIISGAAEGMAASLRAGAEWAMARGAGALMVLLPDLPEITNTDAATLYEAYLRAPETPCRATDDAGRPGHPAIFPARLYPALKALQGDEGARAAFAQEPPRLIPLPGARATTDLDTPEDWARWRAAREP